MPYWMMRLFLSDRLAGTMFDDSGRPPREPREAYLRKVFSASITFVHRKRNYVYTPVEIPDGKILAGVIGREHTVPIRKSPLAKAEDVPDWDTANVFIDPTGEDDGQKVAMQNIPVVGKPLAVFRSLTDHINAQNPSSDWYIAVNTITSETDFWSAIAGHLGKITEIDLVFAAPNMWNGVTETENALKQLDKENGVKETEVKLKNPDGKLNPGAPSSAKSPSIEGRLASAVSYISKGAGRIKAKFRNKTFYNSEENVVKETPEVDHSIQDAELTAVTALAQWLMSKR